MNIEKLTFSELESAMIKHNSKKSADGKKLDDVKKAVIVFTEDSFTKQYSLESRSYEINSNAKLFQTSAISTSLFGSALDGSEHGVRLDWYMRGKDAWKVDYCYFL